MTFQSLTRKERAVLRPTLHVLHAGAWMDEVAPYESGKRTYMRQSQRRRREVPPAEARNRVFDEWPKCLWNGGGAPRTTFAPSDGSAASPELRDANRALKAWQQLADELLRDAMSLAWEGDRLARELADAVR